MSEIDPAVRKDVIRFLEMESYEISDLVVFGASGMLGSYIVDFFSQLSLQLDSKNKIYGVQRSSNKFLEHLNLRDNVELIEFEDFEVTLSKLNRPLVIHAASPSSISSHKEDPWSAIETNVLLTMKLCDILDKINGHLCYLSSGEVYGFSTPPNVKENEFSGFDHLAVRGSYPEVKRLAELILQIKSKASDFSACSLRLFHTFGPGLSVNDSRIFGSVLSSMLSNIDIKLHSSGENTRSFLYAYDLVTAILVTKKVKTSLALNVAGESEMSVRDFAEAGAKIHGSIKVVFPDTNTPVVTESPLLRSSANTDRLRGLGWSPIYSIENGLQNTLESLRWRLKNGLI
jgi:nucleoside-diphosphate-sugar epimerase